MRVRVSGRVRMRLLFLVVFEPLDRCLPLLLRLLLAARIRMRPCVRVVVLVLLIRVGVITVFVGEMRIDAEVLR